MNKVIGWVAVFSLLAAPLTASAGLITFDGSGLNASDRSSLDGYLQAGALTLDSSSGLVWLKLDQTTNLSFIEMDDLLARDPVFSLFRRASVEDTATLMTNAGIVVLGGPQFGVFSPQNVPGALNLLEMIGQTRLTQCTETSNCQDNENGFRRAGRGYTSEVGGLGHRTSSYLYEEAFSQLGEPTGYAFARDGSGQDSFANPSYGHFLILSAELEYCSEFPGGGATGGCFPGPFPFPVPEPGTLALLGLGLVGIGYTRRRKAS
jgi:hypothetical protein